MEKMDYYVLFPNVNEGLKLEKLLKENSMKYTIVPTPRELSKCCGICIKYAVEDERAIKELIERHEIKIEGIKGLPVRKYTVKFI
ncbi:MAG: DUF3343 domain-containing protein [Caulobacteraceae bacterium]